MATGTALPNTLARGRYVLRERIGSGAMAIVLRATDTRLGVDRAIKVIPPLDDEDERRVVAARMRAEARAMAQLSHPHVVRIHDIGREGELDFIVMDLAATTLRRRLDQGGAVPSPQVVRWMVDVLSALAIAHAQGIVHRDVKPENILLDVDDRALLADFGIALLSDLRQTQTGMTLGSMAYMPPEQRLDSAHVNHTADIYAAGATAYTLLTGHNPSDLFRAPADSKRWETVHPGLAAAIQRACAKHPEDRYASAGEFAQALRQVHPDPQDPHPEFPNPSLVFEPLAIGNAGEGDTIMPPAPWRVGPGLAMAGLLVGATLLVGLLLQVDATTTSHDGSSEPESRAPIAWSGPPWLPQGRAAPPAMTFPEVPPLEVASATPVAGATSSPRGVWRASRNGVSIRLTLHGDDNAMHGVIVSMLGGRRHAAPVTGHYNADTRRLWLVEPQSDDRATYEIELSPDLSVGRGTVHVAGGIRQLRLSR